MNINVVRASAQVWAYSVRIELNQGVFLERNPKLRTLATTWQPAALLGSVGLAGLHDAVRDDIRNQVAQFINDVRLSHH